MQCNTAAIDTPEWINYLNLDHVDGGFKDLVTGHSQQWYQGNGTKERQAWPFKTNEK